MSARRWIWPSWIGFLLSLIAFISYPLFFARFPVTRDFPWANILLFVVAGLLLSIGIRRAFQPENTRRGRITSATLGVFGVSVAAFFVFAIFVFARELPASAHAPQVGDRAPDFQLADVNGKEIHLSEILTAPINGKPTKGVLLIFYRGYW